MAEIKPKSELFAKKLVAPLEFTHFLTAEVHLAPINKE
jgi:hypothetical protein